eukprot:augustus_masked-scaffold_18-processed-gene-1.52-mRNA-1 protein AED:1.00 eAED:1.00 QI:0/-1/0/0/-1/1/1/0/122
MGHQTSGSDGVFNFNVKVQPADLVHISRKPKAKCPKLLTPCKGWCVEVKRSSEGWRKSYVAVFKMTAALKENPHVNSASMDGVSEENGIMFELTKLVGRGEKKGEKVGSLIDFAHLITISDN